ncbi:MAG TPA: hypothetical protein VIF02_04220 [Methylocella sp.]|jgi:hypothetical protein
MQIWSNVQALLALLGGGVVVIGAIVAAAYGLVKIFGEKWLDSRFAERREALKHEQQKELEALRIPYARLVDRATKLNQREFDAIPEAWSRLCDAYERTRSLVALLQQHPDIDNMTSEHRDEFIGRCKLEEWEKTELTSAKNKTDYYRKRNFWHEYVQTQEYARELYMYVRKNSILMPIDIRKQFQKLDQLIRTALIEQEHNHQYDYAPQKFEEREKFMKEGETIMTNLEKAIEQRLASLTEAKSL